MEEIFEVLERQMMITKPMSVRRSEFITIKQHEAENFPKEGHYQGEVLRHPVHDTRGTHPADVRNEPIKKRNKSHHPDSSL